MLRGVEKYSGEEQELIRRALAVATDAHAGQQRIMGGPFITHPIAAAQFLIDHGADAETVAAALMHDTVEDTDLTLEEIEQEFGPRIRFLVDGATDVGRGDGQEPIADRAALMEATHRKIRRYVQQDPRICLVKVADRWHNLLTARKLRTGSQRRLAKEALEFHVPLARDLHFGSEARKLEEAAKETLSRVGLIAEHQQRGAPEPSSLRSRSG